MKKSIASVCLSGDLLQKIEATAYAGYDGLEIFENDLMLFNQSPAEVGKIVRDKGLEIVALQPFRDFEGMPADKMQKNFDRAERKFDLMEELGTDSLLICSNVSRHCIDDFNRTVDHFAELAERAAKRNFKIGYEALAWGRHIRDYEQAWKLVKHVDHKNLGIILDSFHIFARSGDLSTIAEIPGDRITLIQIADAPMLDMDVLQWSRHYRCFPGQGDFPMIDFIKAVARTGYDGYISHEIFNDEFRATPCKPNALDGMRSLIWLDEQLHLEEPDLVTNSSTIDTEIPAAEVSAIEFIEFAVDDSAQQQLVGLLDKLGFKQTHKHKSKDVSLYRLGNVSIVVNQEVDSYAQHYFLIHGVSVCAVAFLSNDAEGMAERAKAYHYIAYENDADSGELTIPSVKGIGGELMYFVQDNETGQRFFDVDFTQIADDQSQGMQQRINFDHVTSGVAETEFLSTSLFYRTLFGLCVNQPQDLVDPYGIVVSRTATSRDKKIRLPFNMTRSGGASTERFREAHNGSGIQHIALSCDNILAYVKNVDPDILLPIPSNYYDDLEARFDLDETFARQLRAYNLLYDKTDTGEFIHFYTTSINGLFFEVVQRNKYSNYGEVNAHVRMAAQARHRLTDAP